MTRRSPPRLTCGVLVTDGSRLLLGHATRSPRWDIPKGLAEPGETAREAAIRELAEETGLHAPPEELADLGRHAYRPGKDLALFAWTPAKLPDPATLTCASRFIARDGTSLPEFDRFALFSWDDAAGRVGRDMARLLAHLHPGLRLSRAFDPPERHG